jgi:hypothetical protein
MEWEEGSSGAENPRIRVTELLERPSNNNSHAKQDISTLTRRCVGAAMCVFTVVENGYGTTNDNDFFALSDQL